jgi:hypothetical protein
MSNEPHKTRDKSVVRGNVSLDRREEDGTGTTKPVTRALGAIVDHEEIPISLRMCRSKGRGSVPVEESRNRQRHQG